MQEEPHQAPPSLHSRTPPRPPFPALTQAPPPHSYWLRHPDTPTDLKGRPWGSSSKTPRPGCRGPRSIPGQGTGPHRPHLRAPGLRLEGPHPTTGVQCSTPKNGGGEERQAGGTGVVSKVGESKGVLSLQRGNPGAWVPGWTQGDPGPAAVCRDLLPQACCSPCKVTPSGQSRRHTSVLSRRRSLRSL